MHGNLHLSIDPTVLHSGGRWDHMMCPDRRHSCARKSDKYVEIMQGGLDSAVLEMYKYEAGTSRGDAFPLAWDAKGVHGREPGKGLQGGVNSRGQSLAISYSSQTDLQLFNHSGVQLASVNSSGKYWAPCFPNIGGQGAVRVG
jgi:hypothetical protein